MKKRKKLERPREGATGSSTALAVPMPRESREVEGAELAPTEADDAITAMLEGNAKGLTIGRGVKALVDELKETKP